MTVAIVTYVAIITALVVHEFCHALAGFLMGDETAKRMGRLTLNPIAHADLVGTVLLPLSTILSGLPVIGWAKPVPFNPYNLKYPKWGPVMVALAGPLSNFLSAAIFLIGLKFCLDGLDLPYNNLLVIFLTSLVSVNVFLGIFNFIPVPPLDGSKLINAIFDAPKYRNMRFFLETKGPTLLLIIIMLDLFSPVSILGLVFGTASRAVFGLIGLR